MKERLSGDNVAREGGATQHGLGDDAAGATVEGGALGEYGRDHRAAERGKADRLGNRAHGVGGELPGARAGSREARAGEALETLANPYGVLGRAVLEQMKLVPA
jgi:hypothetical protein